MIRYTQMSRRRAIVWQTLRGFGVATAILLSSISFFVMGAVAVGLLYEAVIG
jgi:hypothetical protein